jgi:hypothetical protein
MAKQYDEYTSRIRESFSAAFIFFKQHKKPRTAADWDRIALSLGDYRDEFTSDLIIAVVDEMERESNHELTRRMTV